MQPRIPTPVQPMSDGPQGPRGFCLIIILALTIEAVAAVIVVKWLGLL